MGRKGGLEVDVAATRRLNARFFPLSFVAAKLGMLIYALINSAPSLYRVALSEKNRAFRGIAWTGMSRALHRSERTSVFGVSRLKDGNVLNRVPHSHFSGQNSFGVLCAFLLLWAIGTSVQAATLPPDAVDIMHHNYDGGGMKINGPSVLVRKSVGPQVSLTGHYYVDTISAASVDVIARASEYEEERTEVSGGIDFLHEKSILSMGYTNSTENDYEANTVYFSAAQDFFGDLTTLSFAYAKGWDDVGTRGSDVTEDLDRNNYKLGLSQVITRNMLLGIDIDVITDEGKLENPYRANRYIDPNDSTGFLYQEEVYPDTRTSTAVGIRSMYYLPYRASLKGEYRFFRDSWGIQAHTYDIGYVHPFLQHWTVETRFRFYTQEQADFYSDLFPFEMSQTHVGRDKELSTFSGTTIGLGLSYELKQGVIPGIDRLQFNLLLDRLDFSYDNFRDVTAEGSFLPGQEPLYEFDALVTRTSLILEF